MTRFVSIASFRSSLSALLKVKRGVYAGIPAEICNAFKGVPIDQIRANHDKILIDNDSIIIKLRLPDKWNHLSKADGYRLIYLVMRNLPVVALLAIYPKRGPMQKLDLGANELVHLLEAFKSEASTHQIGIHDINDNLRFFTPMDSQN